MLDVPLENLTWRVLVPEGWRLAGHDGDFELKSSSPAGEFGLEEYRALARVRQENGSIDAARLLDRAGTWMREGDQQKASQAYTNAVRSNLLDAASGEDARVQLRQLKTQQAVLGLNTRRQKLAIDNRGANSDARLDRAVE